MKSITILIDVLIILIALFAILFAYHRICQFEDKLYLLDSGLSENYPEIMEDDKTESYFPVNSLKDMTVTTQIDKSLLSILAFILIFLFISRLIIELFGSQRRKTEKQ